MKEFRYDLHYFRAIAIIFIVMGHSLGDWSEIDFLSFVKTYIQGGTALFVFISGFFFSYLYNDNFSYKKYLKKKIKNIILPYFLITSFLFVYLYIFRDYKPSYYPESLLISYIIQLFFGKLYIHFWYIPFAFLLFLTAPLFIKFQTLKPKNQVMIIVIGLIISMFIQRPNFTLNPLIIIHSYLYFLPFYFFGIYVNRIDEKLNEIKNRRIFFISILLLTISLVFVYIQVYLFHHTGNYHKEMFDLNGIDLTIPSKMALLMSVYFSTRLVATKEINILILVGNTSFSIYFQHIFWINQFNEYYVKRSVDIAHELILTLLITISAISFSTIFASILKTIIGYRSRYIIGY